MQLSIYFAHIGCIASTMAGMFFNKIEVDVQANGNIEIIKTDVTKLQCVQACVYKNICLHLNYHENDKNCHLLSTVDSYSNKPGWIAIDKKLVLFVNNYNTFISATATKTAVPTTASFPTTTEESTATPEPTNLPIG